MNWTNGVASMTIHGSGNTNLVLTLPAQARESNGTLTNAGRAQISGTLTSNLTVSLALQQHRQTHRSADRHHSWPARPSALFNLTLVSGNLPHNPVTVGVAASAPGFTGASASINIYRQPDPARAVQSPAARPLHHQSRSPDAFLERRRGRRRRIPRQWRIRVGRLSPWFTPPDTNSGFVINDGTISPPSGDGPTAAL